MSARVLEVKREGRASSSFIPSGRQLPRTVRTPPLRSVKKRLHFSSEASNQEREELQQRAPLHTEADDRSPTSDVLVVKAEPEDLDAMLSGMTGYELTQADYEFLENMRVEKLLKKLQGDLEELQRLSVKETASLDVALASGQKAQAGLQKLPSCEDLTEWAKAALETTVPSAEVAHIDAKSLLAILTTNDIGRAAKEKRAELGRLKRMVANKRKKEARAKGELEKQVALQRLKIHGLMTRLSDLTSELGQQEELYKAFEMQIEAPDVPREKDAPVSETQQAARRRAKRGANGRAKALGETEEVRDADKPTRSKLGNSRTGGRGVKEDGEKTDRKSGAAEEVKRAKGPRQAPARGSRRPPGPEEQQEAPLQSRKRAAAEEEAQPPVLRRSKRIANRR